MLRIILKNVCKNLFPFLIKSISAYNASRVMIIGVNMKIACLGAGAWGSCLANLLAGKGYRVFLWTKRKGISGKGSLVITDDLREATRGADLIVESVTSSGLRECLHRLHDAGIPKAPLILTSKGIERETLLFLPEVVADVSGDDYARGIGYLSGPSLACEVREEMPTSVTVAAHTDSLRKEVARLFSTPYFSVYPSDDVLGTAIGGAMKNIVAIACAISDGLGFGCNAKATLMTRGLDEIRALGAMKGCRRETLTGLAGMGDLFATCLSTASRNYRFGRLLARGLTPREAHEEIGMVVEGVKTCVSALEIGRKAGIATPVTETVYSIIYGRAEPKERLKALLVGAIRKEPAYGL